MSEIQPQPLVQQLYLGGGVIGESRMKAVSLLALGIIRMLLLMTEINNVEPMKARKAWNGT